MLRFVVGPEQQLVFDVSATLPGRGLWLSASGDVINEAVKRGVFSRAAKSAVKVPADLRARVMVSLRQRILDFCALARRSGNAISGFEKAQEWLATGRAGLVLQAADGSPDERARFVGGRDVAVVSILNAAELGRIFGREHAVHVAVAPGRLAAALQIDVLRLAGVAGEILSGH
jgi:predicted RNA-binding protein YlxR (DUF448 family)